MGEEATSIRSAADFRRRDFPIVALFTIVAAGAAFLALQQVWPLVWKAVSITLLGLSARAFDWLARKPAPTTSNYVVLGTIAGVSAAGYAVMPTLLWLSGNTALTAFAAIWWCGILLRNLADFGRHSVIAAAGAPGQRESFWVRVTSLAPCITTMFAAPFYQLATGGPVVTSVVGLLGFASFLRYTFVFWQRQAAVQEARMTI